MAKNNQKKEKALRNREYAKKYSKLAKKASMNRKRQQRTAPAAPTP